MNKRLKKKKAIQSVNRIPSSVIVDIEDKTGMIVKGKFGLKPLNIGTLRDKNIKVVTTEEALKDIIPIQWGTNDEEGN